MPSYNVHEAKTNLSQLLKQAERGEDVLIMRDGEPVAKLVRYAAPRKKKRLGFAAGQVWEAPNWEAPMTESEVAALLERE
jgi:prevent-host-death family protein